MRNYLVKGAVNGLATEFTTRAFSVHAAREMFYAVYGRHNVVIYSTTEVKQ